MQGETKHKKQVHSHSGVAERSGGDKVDVCEEEKKARVHRNARLTSRARHQRPGKVRIHKQTLQLHPKPKLLENFFELIFQRMRTLLLYPILFALVSNNRALVHRLSASASVTGDHSG